MCKLAWDRLGGVSSCWKDIFDIPPCSKVTKTLSGTRGYIKNDATHKVCTSTSTKLALREFTKERFEFKNALLGERKKKPLHKSEKKEREKGRRRLEVATDLIEVVRTMGWIGSCWCNVPQQKQHTGKRLSLQNLSSTPLHFYVCINTENIYRNDLFFILSSSHVAGEHISESCTVHRAHCIIMYLYKELYSSTFCSSLQGEFEPHSELLIRHFRVGEPARALQV